MMFYFFKAMVLCTGLEKLDVEVFDNYNLKN